MSILRNSLILFALLISPVKAHEPMTGLLVCSCGDPVILLVSDKNHTRIIPANKFDKRTMTIIAKWCKGKSPIPVWKSEVITGKACPISI